MSHPMMITLEKKVTQLESKTIIVGLILSLSIALLDESDHFVIAVKNRIFGVTVSIKQTA